MYLQCVLGQFGPVAEIKVIVRWPGLSGSISGSQSQLCTYVKHRSYIEAYRSDINQLLTNVETGISRLSADIDITRTWHPMLGTPVDPRTNTGWYLNDVSRMMGEEGDRWRHRIFLPPVTSPMLHESPDHRTMTMGVRSATSSKMAKKTHYYLIRKQCD